MAFSKNNHFTLNQSWASKHCSTCMPKDDTYDWYVSKWRFISFCNIILQCTLQPKHLLLNWEASHRTHPTENISIVFMNTIFKTSGKIIHEKKDKKIAIHGSYILYRYWKQQFFVTQDKMLLERTLRFFLLSSISKWQWRNLSKQRETESYFPGYKLHLE